MARDPHRATVTHLLLFVNEGSAAGVIKSASQAARRAKGYFRSYIPKSQFVSSLCKSIFQGASLRYALAFGRAELNPGHAHPPLTTDAPRGGGGPPRALRCVL